MINAGQVVRDYLVSDLPAVQPLKLLVGDRVWYGTAPPTGYKPASSGPAVLFARRGGGQHYSTALLQPSMQYQCFGKDHLTAEEVYRALYEALDEESGPGLKWSKLETVGQPLDDPDTGWNYVLCAFRHWLANA